MKDIVHQASNQLAVVGVIRDPYIVLSWVHAKLQVGFTQAPAWGTIVLKKKKNVNKTNKIIQNNEKVVIQFNVATLAGKQGL